jgi:hypothetical protein
MHKKTELLKKIHAFRRWRLHNFVDYANQMTSPSAGDSFPQLDVFNYVVHWGMNCAEVNSVELARDLAPKLHRDLSPSIILRWRKGLAKPPRRTMTVVVSHLRDLVEARMNAEITEAPFRAFEKAPTPSRKPDIA